MERPPVVKFRHPRWKMYFSYLVMKLAILSSIKIFVINFKPSEDPGDVSKIVSSSKNISTSKRNADGNCIVGRKKQKTSEVEEAESPGVATRSKSKQKKTDSLPERPLEVSSLHIIETYMVFLSDIQLLEFAEKVGKDADRSINSRISKRQSERGCGNDRKRQK